MSEIITQYLAYFTWFLKNNLISRSGLFFLLNRLFFPQLFVHLGWAELLFLIFQFCVGFKTIFENNCMSNFFIQIHWKNSLKKFIEINRKRIIEQKRWFNSNLINFLNNLRRAQFNKEKYNYVFSIKILFKNYLSCLARSIIYLIKRVT